ncbi:DUF427 domain-containing protein [Romeria aff. gracilis LEGE 07310]|uniref:DUF427 domain-containing protein n=1 Tax=Vasconcelosia minhoensis LEGE 07310 TaxID=915328 RepID=A0A8J7DK79_9CYAN|nr:DUF427 domain-containing protein [Romeria gracilis]MBE9076056.1 DUF427 domain-containing protein [Romeria aff. gracilis LEGE 07310]
MSISRTPPGPGQESVWDYPRPPALEASSQHILIQFNQTIIAETQRSQRVLETSHPPVYYIPPADVQMQYLQLTARQTFCEWKGLATYYTLTVGARIAANVAWAYPQPTQSFQPIQDYLAFYPSRVDCTVDGEAVQAQPGDFYGGWITQNIVGPFKGAVGTWGW